MPRPTKGERTPGSGRKRGTRNKSTVAIATIADKLGINLFEDILGDLAEIGDPVERANIRLKLMDFIYAKRRSIENTGVVDDKPPSIVKFIWNASNAPPSANVEYDHPPGSGIAPVPDPSDQ